MFTLKEIINNNGATINANGTLASYTRGYQVSICDLLTIKTRDLRKKDLKTLLKTIGENACLGIWIWQGLAYIDMSIMIKTKREALKIGKQNKQISIWDWKKQSAVYIKSAA